MTDRIPDGLEDKLADLDPDELDVVSQRVKELVEEKRKEQGETESEDPEGKQDRDPAVDSHGDELPPDVPEKATLTVKTINDNEYYYWQWRDGEQIKSKYKSPKA